MSEIEWAYIEPCAQDCLENFNSSVAKVSRRSEFDRKARILRSQIAFPHLLYLLQGRVQKPLWMTSTSSNGSPIPSPRASFDTNIHIAQAVCFLPTGPILDIHQHGTMPRLAAHCRPFRHPPLVKKDVLSTCVLAFNFELAKDHCAETSMISKFL